MVWIKICGITNTGDALQVCSLGADAVGFILSTDSPRKISTPRAAEIIKALRDKSFATSTVGVFVNESIEKVARDFNDLGLDYVQLTGDEDQNYMMALKNINSNIKVIKSIRIENDYNYQPGELDIIIKSFEGYIDLVLMDSYGKNMFGGTGLTFDWNIAKSYKQQIPLILSGGLDSGNVQDAIRTVNPFGVDASSRLETCPGEKDLKKVADFINALK